MAADLGLGFTYKGNIPPSISGANHKTVISGYAFALFQSFVKGFSGSYFKIRAGIHDGITEDLGSPIQNDGFGRRGPHIDADKETHTHLYLYPKPQGFQISGSKLNNLFYVSGPDLSKCPLFCLELLDKCLDIGLSLFLRITAQVVQVAVDRKRGHV